MLLKPILISLILAKNLFFETLPDLNSRARITPVAEYNCTLSVKCYFITEAGVIGVNLSISAEDCETAKKGVWEAIQGFAKGI